MTKIPLSHDEFITYHKAVSLMWDFWHNTRNPLLLRVLVLMMKGAL